MNSKWRIFGMILTGIGALTGILTSIVSEKQMEEEIDAAVEKRLNPPKDEEES